MTGPAEGAAAQLPGPGNQRLAANLIAGVDVLDVALVQREADVVVSVVAGAPCAGASFFDRS